MDFAVINAIPFVLAILVAWPQTRQLLPRTSQAWLGAWFMLVMALVLVAYFPQVQEIDTQYKIAKGIITESDAYGEDATHSSEDGATQNSDVDADAASTSDVTSDATAEATEDNTSATNDLSGDGVVGGFVEVDETAEATDAAAGVGGGFIEVDEVAEVAEATDAPSGVGGGFVEVDETAEATDAAASGVGGGFVEVDEVAEATDTPLGEGDADEKEANAPPKVNAVVQTVEWVPEIGLTLAFYLDGLSFIFALIITVVGAGIILYAGYYFENDDDFARFVSVLLVFAGAMLGLVLSGNLITLFIMWELTSITSFLLIGFKGYKLKDARFGAMQAFSVTGVGALALVAGFVLLAFITGEVTGTGDFVFDFAVILQADPSAIAAHPLYAGTLILIALGAFTKSAQMPFHFWLPGAMEAPTPASAYLHSATMVKAGVYLLLRLYPPLHANEMWTILLVAVGVGTMLLGALFAFGQRDLKGVLAYLTVSWLGALVAMIGLPDYHGIKAALVGIMAHAFYKAALFLSAGTIDHNTGTRILDELGGLRHKMPVIAGVVVISVLSMGGVPLFFGFVAKEVLLKAFVDGGFGGVVYIVVTVAASIMFAAGLMIVWEVFFKKPTHDIHYHDSPWQMDVTPVVLAVGSVTFGFFIDPPITFVADVLRVAVPKPISIYLLPPSITDPIFLTSLMAIAGGVVLFFLRNLLVGLMTNLRLIRATTIYRYIVQGVDWLGDQAVRTQNGQVRYYLIVILGTVAAVMLSTVLNTFDATPVVLGVDNLNAADILRFILLGVSVVAALYTVLIRTHIHAVLSLGVLGYAIGAIFLLEPAPDVSLVQFLIETIATVLVIIMLGRISASHRQDAMEKLWKGNTLIGDFNVGIVRDLFIAGAVGLTVFLFAFTALANRPVRDTIAQYHLDNTYEQTGVTDVVGAIVADYRAMDTIIEIVVFAAAALGVLTLLTRGLDGMSPLAPTMAKVQRQNEFDEKSLEEVQDATNINTPFTRFVARFLLPLSFIIALSHIINGSGAPGDGFTAGAILGLITALYFVIFGYREVRERFRGFAPHRLMRAGLFIAFINAAIPIVLGLETGTFLAHVDYGKLLGISDFLSNYGLKFTTALVYEIGICLTVFGGTGLIMEAIAHPKETDDMTDETQV